VATLSSLVDVWFVCWSVVVGCSRNLLTRTDGQTGDETPQVKVGDLHNPAVAQSWSAFNHDSSGWLVAASRLPQLDHRGPLLWNRDAIGSQCDLLSVFCGDLGVNVKLCPAIGAEGEIVHTL
jgi:hypothetical protein